MFGETNFLYVIYRDLFSVIVFPYVICHDPLVHPFYNQYNLSHVL